RMLGERRPHALVVEDDNEAREVLLTHLVNHGFDVTALTDGVELLDYVRAMASGLVPMELPDIALLDFRLPAWSGLDGAELIRAHGFTHLPIVLMTGFPDAFVRAGARRLRTHLVEKPLELNGLLLLI